MALKKVGIIGFGNMGAAIAERIKNKYKVIILDKDKEKTERLSAIEVCADPPDLLNRAEVIILAVKPLELGPVLAEIKESAGKRLIISIAAGITTEYMRKILGRTRIIRVMPNICAIIGQGVSYICKGELAGDEDIDLSVKIFSCLGRTFILSEDLMDAATAVGGSGPGFWGYLVSGKPITEWGAYASDYFIPELTAAAVSVGFDKKIARLSAGLVAKGSGITVDKLRIAPEELTKRVASKGGTTEAGLEVLQKGGSLTEAVKAAFKRAEELSQNY